MFRTRRLIPSLVVFLFVFVFVFSSIVLESEDYGYLPIGHVVMYKLAMLRIGVLADQCMAVERCLYYTEEMRDCFLLMLLECVESNCAGRS